MLRWGLEEDSEEGRALPLVSLVAGVASAASSRGKVRRGKPREREALVHPRPTVIAHAAGPCTASGLHAPPFVRVTIEPVAGLLFPSFLSPR